MKKLKDSLKFLLVWALCILVCFVIVFLWCFFVGWELFESGDPIKIELGISVILGSLFFVIINTIFELEKKREEQVKSLEKRIEELEKNK